MAEFDADRSRADKFLVEAQQVAQGRYTGARRGKLPIATVTAMIAHSDEFAAAWLGDSTVDGEDSTGWTANPVSGGVPVGTTDHGLAGGANSCTPAFKATIVDMFTQRTTANTLVWNAGYGGKSIFDGWMYTNFEKAIIDNPAYGTPDVLIIQPGLNDDANFLGLNKTDAYAYYLMALVLKAQERGIVVALMACDPIGIQSVSGRDNRRIVQLLDTIKEDIADILGCVWLDHTDMFKSVMEHSFPVPTRGYAQSNVAAFYEMMDTDTGTSYLHGRDRWQATKGEITACLFNPNVVHVYPGERRGLTTLMNHVNLKDIAHGTNTMPNRQGGNETLASTVAVNDAAEMDTHVFLHGPDFSFVYRMIDGENFSQGTTSGVSRVRHTSMWDDTVKTVRPGVLMGFAFNADVAGAAYTYNRRCDQPSIVLPGQPGLNKLSWLPGTQESLRYMGNFEVWPALLTPQSNALKHGGVLERLDTGVTGGVPAVVDWSPEAPDLSNVMSLQPGGKVDLLIEGVLPAEYAWPLVHTPRWSGISIRGDRTGLMLFRSGDNVQLRHLHTHLGTPGFSGSIVSGALGSSSEAVKLRVRWAHNDTTKAVTLTVYSGWDNLSTVVLTKTFAIATDSAPPTCGVVGGIYYSGGLADGVSKRCAMERIIINRQAA